MEFLGIEITKVFLIDSFIEEENMDWPITDELILFFQQQGVEVESRRVTSRGEILDCLLSVFHSQDNQGTIIHFIGHGTLFDGNYIGFGDGNNTFRISWAEIAPILKCINTRTENQLIINTMIMCGGAGIFNISKAANPSFYCAIGSVTNRGYSAMEHSKQLYNRRYRTIQEELTSINDGATAYQDTRPYEMICCPDYEIVN